MAAFCWQPEDGRDRTAAGVARCTVSAAHQGIWITGQRLKRETGSPPLARGALAHGGGQHASRWGPLWFLRKYPHRRVIIGSASDLAEENGPAVTCRKIMLRSTGRHLSPAQPPV